MASNVKGGHRLKAWARKAKRAKGTKIEIGYFPAAPKVQAAKFFRRGKGEETPIGEVAARNEYGVGAPERPFFAAPSPSPRRRSGQPRANGSRARRSPRPMEIPRADARHLGDIQAEEVKRQVIALKRPPNEPDTVARKGSKNPLVDTGRLGTAWRSGWTASAGIDNPRKCQAAYCIPDRKASRWHRRNRWGTAGQRRGDRGLHTSASRGLQGGLNVKRGGLPNDRGVNRVPGGVDRHARGGSGRAVPGSALATAAHPGGVRIRAG